ncbi:MAG: hypothetical protein ACPGO3_00885 [Magnetospiraceae bacterium]
MKRRQFLGMVTTVTAGAGLAGLAIFDRPQRVLVIGGGVAGSTFAAQFRAAAPEAEVTLVDRHPEETAAGLLSQGVKVYRDDIQDIDWSAGRAVGWNGFSYDFDRLVMAPGVAFRGGFVEGYDSLARSRFPALWSGPADADRFMRRLSVLPDGGTVLITLPEGPFRFPEGPALRAGQAADYLRRHNPRAKVIVLDAGKAPGADAARAAGVEWISGANGGRLIRVDAAQNQVRAEAGPISADLINIIPPQWAGELALRSGLADATGWCPVDVSTGRSARIEKALVIGDAVTDFRKTAEVARASAVHAVRGAA